MTLDGTKISADLQPQVVAPLVPMTTQLGSESPEETPDVHGSSTAKSRYILRFLPDGTLEYNDPERRFKARIAADGSIRFSDRSRLQTQRWCLFGICPYKLREHGVALQVLTLNEAEFAREGVILEGLERYELRSRHRLRPKPVPMPARGEIGWWTKRQVAASKRDFANATQGLRQALNLAARKEAMQHALEKVDDDLNALWRQPDREARISELVAGISVAERDHEPQRGDSPQMAAYRQWMSEKLKLYRSKIRKFVCGHAAPGVEHGFSGDAVAMCSGK
jgi:hypothetical protein